MELVTVEEFILSGGATATAIISVLTLLALGFRSVRSLDRMSRDLHDAKRIAERVDAEINRDDDNGSMKGRLRRVEENTVLLTRLVQESTTDRRQINERLAVIEDRLDVPHEPHRRAV
jgi:hypothetical protein